MKKAKLGCLIVFIGLFWAFTCYAQSTFISNGVVWLSGNQNADGSWGMQADLTCIYSTEAINALKSSGAEITDYNEGITWLTSQDAISTDELSRKISSLVNAGIDSSTSINTLLSYKNSDGGWSYKDSPVSDPYDTSLALQALKAANYSDTTILYQAVSYLTSNQNSDDGWGFVSGDGSNAYVTAMALRALSSYNSLFLLQDPINKASSYLLTKQNTDGGFGSSPSTIYETALSIISLIESGQGSTLALQSAINYLTSAQSSNGSWSDDPYSTALALQALAAARANLTISSISLSKSMPRENEETTITATIGNTGYEDASNITVRFFLGDPSSGGTQIGTDQVIPSLALGSSSQVAITQSFTGTGGKTIFVVADPDGLISETSESDNKSSSRIWVATGPDLAVYSEDLKPSTYVPTAGTAFTLEYTVRNLGESETGAFTISLYDGDPASGGTLLQTGNISGLAGTEVRTGSLGVTLSTDGQHTLYLVADSGNAVTEISETNNTGTVTVTVGGLQGQVDLAVTSSDITLTPSRPTANETVQISAIIRNQGYADAGSFIVDIYDNAPESGGTLIQSQTVSSLASGATHTATANVAISSGIHDLYVIVDRTNAISEADESNNTASVRVMTDMVDINISATDLSFTPSHPVSGDSVLLSVTVHNAGIKETGAFNLALYDGDPASGGALLQTYAVSSIQGDGSTTVSYTFTAIPWTYRFYAIADTESVVTELYEDNNQAIRSLKIKAPGEILGPDLVPTKIDLSALTTDPLTLSVSGAAAVTLQNKGDDKITSSFSVLVFEDTDLDGAYTPGLDNVLGTGANTLSLWPEGAGLVNVTLSGSVKFLNAPIYAYIDSSDSIREQDETNNLLNSCADCEKRPEKTIEPVVKWKWQQPSMKIYNHIGVVQQPPVIVNLTDDNQDGRTDDQDIPSILFNMRHEDVYSLTGEYTYGRVRAFRGDTGSVIFSLYDSAHPTYVGSYTAAADIDHDGTTEFIAVRDPGNYGYGSNKYQHGLVAFRHDGTLKWDNLSQVKSWNDTHAWEYKIYLSRANLSITDIDGDGTPEIVGGSAVFNSDGSPRCVRDRGLETGTGDTWTSTIVADLDMDGVQEMIAGNTAYNADCTVKWFNKNLPDGRVAVVNFDGDPYPEVALLTPRANYLGGGSKLRLYLLEHDGNIKWGPVILSPSDINYYNYAYEPPLIADFDGDGKPEIGVRALNKYYILDSAGAIKKTLTMPMDSPAYPWTGYWPSAPSVFDLNGDGRPEVIFNNDSNGYFSIFDGTAGTLLFKERFGGSGVPDQNVYIADVDGDNQTEIIAFGYNTSHSTRDAIRVYEAKNDDWVPARKIWNQSAYHVTNINDDGSVPQHESPSWLLNNGYLTQTAIGTSTNPYLTPNLTASYLRSQQNGASLEVTVRVGNGGAKEATPGVSVSFFSGSSAGTLLGTVYTTQILQPGEYEDVTYSIGSGYAGISIITAVVDHPGAVSECREDDNQVSLSLSSESGMPDLTVGTEGITLSSAPYYEGSFVSVTANIKNAGYYQATNASVRLYDGNPQSGGTHIGATQTIASIDAGGSVSVTFSFDTLGMQGSNVLYVVLDQENSIIEASETNNTALFTIDIQQPQLPNLTITADAVQITPSSAQEGEQVAISAIVTNRGASASNIPVRFYLGDPASGGTLIAEQTIYQILTLGQSAAVQATLDTTGRPGQQNVFVKVDPANTISESSEDDNIASKSIVVQSAGLAASMGLDKATYQANETAAVTITITNSASAARSLSLDLFVQDSAGNRIATVTQAEPVTIGLNSTATISKTWNSGKTLAESYTVTAELSESGRVVSRTSVGFAIAPDKQVDAKVTTDKISYNPNESSTITSTITSQSQNYIFENLTAKITISRQETADSIQVYTETKTLSTLMPGAAFTFKVYWNTGTNAPGTYPVTLEVKDASGAVLSTSTVNLTISSDLKPSVLLRGQISLDTHSILSGEPVTATYSATNVGNMDLSDVTFSVVIVDAASATVYDDTVAVQAALSMGQTYTNTGRLDTANYSAKDYLVILRASINGTEETLAGTYFRVEGAPSAPSLSLPGNGTDVETLTPLLVVNNASDPNDDRLSYEFELYADSGLTNQAAGASGQGTVWTVSTALTENQTYYWRARAYDGRLYGEWMSAASFRVNTVNDPPTAPTPASPVDQGTVDTLTPVLTVNNASDPDSGSLTYNFEVALDPDFTQIAASVQAVFSGQGTTSWQAPVSLAENATYYWRARADDWLIEGPWMTAASFFVNTANDAPTAPVITSPANNAETTTTSPDIVLTNSTDPDSTVLAYYFELDTVMTFDSGSIIRSGMIPQGQDTTTWPVTGLKDNTQYYVRAKASDGQAESPSWSDVNGFFVNTTNDAPSVPVLANPSDKGAVNTHTPALSIQNSTDPDKDVLTYEFEVYSDSALTALVTSTTNVSETAQTTSWIVPVSLIENQTYYWRARASDGELRGDWMTAASFMVNTANDAPGSPKLHAPAEGSSLATLTPALSVTNAVDPDSDNLTYDFEVYVGDVLLQSLTGVPQDSSGIITSISLSTPLSDNTKYRWRARAYDGDRYGAWMDMATFSIHIPVTTINATIDFDPDTLNKKSNGTWVVVYIELPAGHNVSDINISSIRLEGTIPAEARPSAVGDHDKDGTADLMVKFKRSEVINLLPPGEKVPVTVTGVVGTTTFEGMDIIRVIP
jgi:large repetitive protein